MKLWRKLTYEGLLLMVLLSLLVAPLFAHGSKAAAENEEDDYDDEEEDERDAFQAGHIDEEHIKEHGEEFLDKEKKMTDTELRWHYFRQHDNDANRKLDGLELMVILEHSQPPKMEVSDYMKKKLNLTTEADIESYSIKRWVERTARMIDRTLRDHDKDNDGYLTYTEYIQAIDKKYIKVSQS